MQVRKIGDLNFCRAGWVDHAMGGVWGLNVEYTVFHEGICYNLVYEGVFGTDIEASGEIGPPRPEKEINPEIDPMIFAALVRSFLPIRREAR
jgi:hypothetical protein